MSRTYRFYRFTKTYFRLYRRPSHYRTLIVGREDTFSSIEEIDAKPKTTIRLKTVPPDLIPAGRDGISIDYMARCLVNKYDSVDRIAKILSKLFSYASMKECYYEAVEAICDWNYMHRQRSPDQSRRGERRRCREERRNLAKEHAKLSAQHKEPELPKDYEADLRESKRRFRKMTHRHGMNE